MGGNEANELRKTFIERAALTFWVPDEVADAEGSEVFAHVPGGQPGDCATAFILPNPFTDSLGIGRGNIDGGVQRNIGQDYDG